MAESLLVSPTVGNMMESDIPGALLREPLASHTTPELGWQLLYRGIKYGISESIIQALINPRARMHSEGLL